MVRPLALDPDTSLDRVLDLFWQRGYRDVSVDDLVHGTGLNRHSLYARFKSKYGLAEVVLRRYCEQGAQRTHAVLHGAGSPAQRLQAFMQLRSTSCEDEFFRTMLERGCFALRMITDMRDSHPEIAAIVGNGVENILAELASVVREGQQIGEIRRDTPAESLARTLYSVWLAAPLLPPNDRNHDAVIAALN